MHEPKKNWCRGWFVRLRAPGRVNLIEARRNTAFLVCCIGLWCASSAAALDLSLERAIALAHERSPLVALERQKLAEARADSQSAAAAVLPRISLSAYHNRLNEDRLSPAGGGLAISLFGRENFAGVQARQLLFDGGRARALQGAANRGIDTQEIAIEASRDDVALQVAQGYARALESSALVHVAAESLRRQDEFVKLAEVLFGAGRATRLDGLRAEAQREDARRTLERAKEAEKLALVVLRRAIALPAEEPIRLTDPLPATFAAPRDDATLAKLAIDRNTELKRIAQQIQQADENRAASRSSRWPELSLLGTYGNRSRDVGGSAPEWTVGVFANWTLFDGGAIDGQVAKSHARVSQLEDSQRALILALEADVRDAASAWRTATADAAAAQRLLEANRESLKAALALYQTGKATALDVLSAQSDVVRAEGGLTQARSAYAIARARALRLTGVPDLKQLEDSP